jgi:hypothetical protein
MEELEMKKINKRILDECIEMTRQFWGGEERKEEWYDHILEDRIDTARKAEVDWNPLLNLLDGILSSCGFNPEASNWDIYLVLRLLGWEVVDEIEESESL